MARSLTPPQLRALHMIVKETEEPFSAGNLPIYRISSRMVNSYRIARILLDKGLVTRMGDTLYITDLGRKALEESKCSV
jgi:hypothetical protein